jgi:hypothetical protein
VLPLRARPVFDFAGRFVVAGAQPGPAGQVRGGRELAHVDADLGDDYLGGAFADAGDGHKPAHLVSERGDHPVHLGVEAVDTGAQMIDVGQVHADHQGVVLVEATQQRLAQLGDPRPHPGQGHIGEDLGVAFPCDERFEHPPRRLTHHVGDHLLQLDPGVL